MYFSKTTLRAFAPSLRRNDLSFDNRLVDSLKVLVDKTIEKAKKYGIDADNADASLGVHTV